MTSRSTGGGRGGSAQQGPAASGGGSDGGGGARRGANPSAARSAAPAPAGPAAAGGADPQGRYSALDEALSALLAALDSKAGARDAAIQLAALADAALPPDGGGGSGWRPPGALVERLWRHAFVGWPDNEASFASYALGNLGRHSGVQQQLLTEPAVDGLGAALLGACEAEAEIERGAPAAVAERLLSFARNHGLNLSLLYFSLFCEPHPDDTPSTAARRDELHTRALLTPGVPYSFRRATLWLERLQMGS
jgi:hypothetical protein